MGQLVDPTGASFAMVGHSYSPLCTLLGVHGFLELSNTLSSSEGACKVHQALASVLHACADSVKSWPCFTVKILAKDAHLHSTGEWAQDSGIHARDQC